MTRPDSRRSIDSYRTLAGRYDGACRRIMPVREHAVALLDLRPGDVVVDMASGTGLSFPLLMRAIGPSGHLVAIEHSPEMMALARRRVREGGWSNVTLIEAGAEMAVLPMAFDAVLFHFAHDVLRSRTALEQLFAHAKPGARIAAAGTRLTSWWLAPLNCWVMLRARRYLTTYAGLRTPWRELLAYAPGLVVRLRGMGTGYVACGRFEPGLVPRACGNTVGSPGSAADPESTVITGA